MGFNFNQRRNLIKRLKTQASADLNNSKPEAGSKLNMSMKSLLKKVTKTDKEFGRKNTGAQQILLMNKLVILYTQTII